jgi:glycosyltransferase involved in cell wall biosynthesis
MTPTCDLILPCRNEAAALPTLLARVPADVRAVVVDNGSRDGTAAVALRLGATLVVEPRPGYGAAVRAGVAASTADLVAVMDGDGSLDPAELGPLLDSVTRGDATMAAGRRRAVRGGVLPWHARLGNALALARLRRRTGLSLHDVPPVRVCRRTDLLDLGVQDTRFGYPVELLVRAARAGWVVSEHDVSYRPRAAGTRSKVSGSLVGSARAAHDLVRALP